MSYKIVAKQPSILWSDINEINDRIDAKYYHCDYMVFNIKNYGEFEIKSLKQCVNFFETGVSNFNDGNIKLKRLKTSNIQNGFILYQDLTDCVVPERDKKKILCKGDVVLTTYGTGSIGKVAYVNFDTQIIPDYTIAILRTKKTIDSGYLASFLGSIYGKQQIMRRVIGTSGITLVIKPHLIDIQIPIPSPEIQKYIGDKVRKAEELREEAKTLQKEIDILLEVDMLLKEETDKVYNIYDSKINWTNEINIEDRIDPNFYQKKYISTIEKLGNNKVRLEKYVRITKTRYQTGNINKYIEISSINNSFGTIDEVEELRPEEIPTSAKYQVKEGDILVSLVRPTRKAISIVTKEYDNAICTGGFAVLQSKGKVPVEFLTAVLRTNFVGIQFERYCAGSTYPTINEDDVVKVFIPMYSENQINKITENYRRIIDNIYTSKKLIQEAKQDVEDLIEGNFDMSKVKANS